MACAPQVRRASASGRSALAALPGNSGRRNGARGWMCGIGSLVLLAFVACNFHPSSPPLAGQGGRRHPCVKRKVLD